MATKPKIVIARPPHRIRKPKAVAPTVPKAPVIVSTAKPAAEIPPEELERRARLADGMLKEIMRRVKERKS